MNALGKCIVTFRKYLDEKFIFRCRQEVGGRKSGIGSLLLSNRIPV